MPFLWYYLSLEFLFFKSMSLIVNVSDLSFSYPEGIRALSGLNFRLQEGDSLGIIGPNGAGKTTLLLSLAGVLEAKGRVEIDGMVLKRENLASIRERIGFLFQDPNDQLFMPTVFEDVAFGLLYRRTPPGEIEEKVLAALEMTDIRELKERIAHHLSFGEKRRTTLAGILVVRPKILILDEPTSNLDLKHRKDFLEIIKRLDSTKVIASHDLEAVFSLCNKILVLDGGQQLFFGTTAQFMERKDILQRFDFMIPLSLLKSKGACL